MAVKRNMSPNKCPMPVQDPEVRRNNFEEVALGYTYEMAVEEAKRCLNCPKKPCRSACPVAIDIPAFIERVAKRVSLKEQVVDFPPQPVITRDNVTMQIDTVVYFYITDPKLYAYGVENPIAAIENLTATTLRNIIGDLELDNTLTSRDVINTKICLLYTSPSPRD